MVGNQVLVDALRRQAGFELVEDDLPPRLTEAGLPSPGVRRRRADGRLRLGGLF